MVRIIASMIVALWCSQVVADVTVTDDSGRQITLDGAATRIISLAPHITETLFAIGAGDRIVGAVSYSNYPPEAKSIPRVGGYHRLDLESIIALKPDLVVAWASGNNAAELETLERLGFPLFRSEPQRIEDIASEMERLGQLSGTEKSATSTSHAFRQQLQQLIGEYAQRPRVSVFYEIWPRPLMTLNGEHIVNDALELCGGKNIFSDLTTLAPQVSEEAVLTANPEVIVAGGMGEEDRGTLEQWRRWSDMTAVRRNNLFVIPPDLIQRSGPRILEGMKLICEALEVARGRRQIEGPSQ